MQQQEVEIPYLIYQDVIAVQLEPIALEAIVDLSGLTNTTWILNPSYHMVVISKLQLNRWQQKSWIFFICLILCLMER